MTIFACMIAAIGITAVIARKTPARTSSPTCDDPGCTCTGLDDDDTHWQGE